MLVISMKKTITTKEIISTEFKLAEENLNFYRNVLLI